MRFLIALHLVMLFDTGITAAISTNQSLRDIFIRSNQVEADLTCFTCQKSSTNENCNIKAIDESCSQANDKLENPLINVKMTGCMTIHRFNTMTRETIYIEKKCVQKCTASMVGCSTLGLQPGNLVDQNVQTCSYCCDKDYCNLKTVLNMGQALNLTGNSLENKTAPSMQTRSPVLILGIFVCLFSSFV